MEEKDDFARFTLIDHFIYARHSKHKGTINSTHFPLYNEIKNTFILK